MNSSIIFPYNSKFKIYPIYKPKKNVYQFMYITNNYFNIGSRQTEMKDYIKIESKSLSKNSNTCSATEINFNILLVILI